MKIFIPIFILFFSFNLGAEPEDNSSAEKTELKKEKFYYPVLTLNTEVGQRFSFEPIDDLLEDDFELADSYSFTLGSYRVKQQITKISRANFSYSFNNKKYSVSKDLDNNSGTFSCGFFLKILPILTGDFNFNYRQRNFIQDNEKDNRTLSPGVEFKLKPRKQTLIDLKYVYANTDYPDKERDSNGNRVLLSIQESLYEGHLRLKGRYRGENQDYLTPSKVRNNSAKHSFAVTANIDFN